MMTKERTEIAQTVNAASRARRPMYVSMPEPLVPGPAPRRGARRLRRLLLPEERHRTGDRRRLAVRAIVLARGDVPHVRLDHAHAHRRRSHADHADDVGLLRGDLPDLLAELDPLLLRHPEGLPPLLHQLSHAGR